MTFIRRQPLTPEQALERARDMCNRAEHCSGEIIKKFRDKGLSEAACRALVERLRSERLVDDDRFARMFVRDKIEYMAWGRRKIAMALAAKRVDRDVISRALDTIDEDVYLDRLRHVVERKRRALGDEAGTYDGRTKLFRYGVSRGFEPDLVARILRTPHPED